MNETEAQSLWLRAVEEVKDQTTRPTLWRALELSHGVTLDGNIFVIGFMPVDFPMAGHLRSSECKPIIERVLSEMLRKPIVSKIIDGVTVADYENIKKQEAAAAATREAMLRRRYEERRADRVWDELAEQITRKYATSKLRQLPQVRARFLDEALRMISDAMDELYPDNPDDLTERATARVFDKLSTLVEVPATLLAYELFQRRTARK